MLIYKRPSFFYPNSFVASSLSSIPQRHRILRIDTSNSLISPTPSKFFYTQSLMMKSTRHPRPKTRYYPRSSPSCLLSQITSTFSSSALERPKSAHGALYSHISLHLKSYLKHLYSKADSKPQAGTCSSSTPSRNSKPAQSNAFAYYAGPRKPQTGTSARNWLAS